MKKATRVNLSGHTQQFTLTDEAYEALRAYLEEARLRLHDDPHREEVLFDLELAIGEKLIALEMPADGSLSRQKMDAVLSAMGPVDGGTGVPEIVSEIPQGKRRLYRIQEGQDIFGVCQGIALYATMDVDWVRTIFVIGSLVTGGILAVVYLAMAFWLPIVPTKEAYLTMHQPASEPA